MDHLTVDYKGINNGNLNGTITNGNYGSSKRSRTKVSDYLQSQRQLIVDGDGGVNVKGTNKLKLALKKETFIPHPRDIQNSPDQLAPFCVSFTALENLHPPVSQTEGTSNLEYQLKVSLFDSAYHQFFGRQWAGPYQPPSGLGGKTRPRLKYNQNIYFHTSIHSPSIIAVVELVGSGLDETGRLKKLSCGWGFLRVFKDGDMPDSSRNIKPPQQKMQLYYGTPRALLFMDEPIEASELIKPIPECQMGFTVVTHQAMFQVAHLLPENAIVGSNDVIPGLVDSETSSKDRLKKPQLLNSVPCTIEGLSIQLNPTIEKFEEEVCNLIHEDRLNMQNRAMDGTSAAIMERRLLVGAHNGWCFVEKPQTVHLETRTALTTSLKTAPSPTFRRSQRFKNPGKMLQGDMSPEDAGGNYLMLKHKVQVPDLLEDPMFAVVFILEYIIGEPVADEDRKKSSSLMRGNTRSVTLRWAAWNPFLQPNLNHVTVGLVGGPVQSPDGEFVFKVPDTAMQDEMSSRTAGGLVTFQWSFGSKDGVASTVTMSQAAHLGPPAIQMGSMRSMMSGPQSIEGSEAMEVPASRKPPSGRPSASYLQPVPMHGMMGQAPVEEAFSRQLSPFLESHPGPTSLAVPQGQQGILQPQHIPTQYPQVYSQSMPQQVYIPMHQGPVSMFPMQGQQVAAPIKDLQELQYTPSHAPILTAGPKPKQGSGLSRAAYAKLYSVGFPPVLDRNGEPPEVIDPNTHVVNVDIQKELNDPLQCNEIVFQFLAFSRMLTVEGTVPNKTAGTVFFSFQFYRNQQVTTERLLLSKPQNDLTSDSQVMPFVLQKLDKDGTLMKGPPGLEIRYFMDPAYMKPGETQLFLQHMSQQTMYIDVWDGDSLLPLGSTAVDLKYLCRAGMEAVQTTFELDVISTEYQEDPNLAHGEAGHAGGVRPANVQSMLRGKLHLRLANIGHPVDPKAAQPGLYRTTINEDMTTTQVHSGAYISLPSKSVVVVSQIASKSAYGGGSLVAVQPNSEHGAPVKKRVARAQHVAENNPEVVNLLFSKKAVVEPEKEVARGPDAERQRKLARMQAVRNIQGEQDKPVTLMSHKSLKEERTRDLKTLEVYRMQSKKSGIISMLSQSITTEHTIHPSFGTSEFFEFVLRNPYNEQQTVAVEWEDKSLNVVTEAREWRYLKQLNQLGTQIEEGLFNRESKTHLPEIFLRPKETVNIPFKFLSYAADQSVTPQGPVDPFRQEMKTKARTSDNLKTRVVKVFFKGEDGKPLAILLLKIEPQPHIIDQTFRFHSPEQTFLKKSIRLPPLQSLPGAPVGGQGLIQTFVRCSDPNVICDTKTTQPGEPQDVFMKVPLGASPQIKRFFMAVYLDPFLSRPIQIWQFYVHALQRVDVSAVEGQTSRFSLLLRGTQASRLVQCFSSHPQEMTLYPGEQFMLAAGAVHELNVAIRPMQEGNKFFYLNVVDVEFHQLVRTWLICVSARAPMISRAFELVLPVGGGKGCSKKISYTNPYPHKKTFLLHCNRDDLLQFKENTLEIEGGGSQTIGLRFVPVMKSGTAEILVFINDEDDKNEETFRVSAMYQRV